MIARFRPLCYTEPYSLFTKGGDVRNMKRIIALLLALAVLAPALAAAETRVWVFPDDDPPPELIDTAYAVADGEVKVRLTFAGDCVLGDDARAARGRNSFSARIAKEGMAYPFSLLEPVFANDDFTIVNLEGVLSDSGSDKADKEFNFRGDEAYAEIMKLGSIECVSTENNHIFDYGRRGAEDTYQTLDAAGIGRFDAETLCVLEKDGARIGLTAMRYAIDKSGEARLERQIETLRGLGCGAVIFVMHAGTEYASKANAEQTRMAQKAAQLGAALVVGHHPHVPQNVELFGSTPIVYSLGNCCFGGNLNPAKRSALLLSAELTFSCGSLQALDWSLMPIAICGGERGNNFRPHLLEDKAAAELIERLDGLSDMDLEPYAPHTGARQRTILYDESEE